MEYRTVLIITISVLVIISLIKLNEAGFECLKNPCSVHGICIDDINSPHKCYCMDGFTGYSCEQNWDECRAVTGTSPCLNGGTCYDGIASFNCSCPEPFAGQFCERNLLHCDDNYPCENNGTCSYTSPNETGLCLCPTGFTGSHCQEDVSMCNTVGGCLNGGTCVDDIGNKFYCQCEAGWHGHLCQLPIDDCASAVCHNGGICVDKVNDFSCACQFGYTGKVCETKLPICEEYENPCENKALCLVEDEQKKCYCVPDFHGSKCELKYNECDPPTRCLNGGICVDDVGDFKCSCPPTFFGHTCQCSMNDSEMSAECLELLSHLHTTESTIMSTTFSSRVTSTPVEPRDDKNSSIVVPDSTWIHGVGTSQIIPLVPTAVIPPLLSSPYDPGGLVSSVSSWTILPEPSFSSRIIDDMGESSHLMRSSSLLMTQVLESTATLITTFVEETAGLSDRQSDYDPCPSLSVDDLMDQTPTLIQTTSLDNIPSHFLSASLEVSSTRTFPQLSSSSILIDDSNELISEFPPAYLTSTMKTPLLSTSFDSSLWEVPDSSYPFESSLSLESTSILYPIESSRILDLSSILPPFSLLSLHASESSSMGLLPSPSFVESTISSDWDQSSLLIRSPDLVSISTSPFQGEGRGNSLQFSSTLPPSSIMASTFQLDVITPTASFPPPSVTILPSITPPVRNESDICDNYCRNNAKCIATSIEPICLCPFKYVGKQCEEMQAEIQIPSFYGESYLKYELQRASANIIEIKAQMATIVKDGILMYSTIGRIYALVYIQNGLVTLHFSCGAQSMHFVETRTRVDNGFHFTLAFHLENVIHGQDELRCIGQVSLNESYSMRGEQIVDRNTMSFLEPPIKTVFLGGLDQPDLYTNDDIIKLIPGFVGCVYHLQVNEETLSMFQDAKDGREISECSTLGCVNSPCQGQSRCVSSKQHPFWQCICPPGFEGVRCNLRTCGGENPCKNGATCTTSPSQNSSIIASSKICLCPLGFNGDLCQQRVNLTKPSFHGTADYSSFIAYDPIPRFADWMQLKFHFTTKNMSQFALLMYAGSEVENVNIVLKHHEEQQQLESPPYEHDQLSPVPDFFAISFLQGFIAITWNLGSGSQRIVTPSRIDNKLNVHTLFAGRQGRLTWLKVDGMRNTTGKTPGPLYRLNVNSDLYVGGHEIPRFEGLPHDLPLHTGFQGCIYDLAFRLKNKLFFPRALRGRNVDKCSDDC